MVEAGCPWTLGVMYASLKLISWKLHLTLIAQNIEDADKVGQ